MADTSTTPQTAAEKFKSAALAVVNQLKVTVAQSDAEKLVEDLAHALLHGIVAGVELVSPPGILSIEKLAFPWLETKGDAAADGLIHVLFAKLGEKASGAGPAVVDSGASPAAQLNAL
jgi:hypothetical protein